MPEEQNGKNMETMLNEQMRMLAERSAQAKDKEDYQELIQCTQAMVSVSGQILYMRTVEHELNR